MSRASYVICLPAMPEDCGKGLKKLNIFMVQASISINNICLRCLRHNCSQATSWQLRLYGNQAFKSTITTSHLNNSTDNSKDFRDINCQANLLMFDTES